MREIENEALAQKINSRRTFEPKIKDSLDDVIEIIDMPDVEHKKIMYPYVEPTVQTADEIDKTQEIIVTDFINLKTLFDEPGDVAAENKINKKIETLIDDVTNEKIHLILLMIFGGKKVRLVKKIFPKLLNSLKKF